jgi:SAM-dependent methyltransferase
MPAFKNYLKSLYTRTMTEAYATAYQSLAEVMHEDALLLDCGAGSGNTFAKLSKHIDLPPRNYRGLEWDSTSVESAQSKGLAVEQADLNKPLPFAENTFSAVLGLSVLEHLLYPCHFVHECYRVLQPGGKLVLLTPNIATYFTAALILAGRMPSSGPHPDSSDMLQSRKLTSLREPGAIEGDTPLHRHLVVFSYVELRQFLISTGFRSVAGRGFGVYPFPRWLQPVLERVDAKHAHQMVFTATK